MFNSLNGGKQTIFVSLDNYMYVNIACVYVMKEGEHYEILVFNYYKDQ